MVRMRIVNTKEGRWIMQTQQQCGGVGGILGLLLTTVGSLGMCCVAEAAGFCITSELEVMANLQVAFRAAGEHSI